MRPPRLAAACAAALLTAPAAAQVPKAPTLPEGTEVRKDLAYGPHDRHKLDLYLPKDDGPLPLIMWVHGGGWEGGSKDGPNPAVLLLARGYAVAAVNYRLSKHAVFPAQIHDCKAAVRYLRARAKDHNLNPDKFAAWGASAGGHLAALLGTAGDVPELEGDVGDHKGTSSKVQAVIDWFGPTALSRLAPPPGRANAVTRLVGGPLDEKKELAALGDPITHVSKGDPPTLLVHGDKDRLVPLSQSELLRDALSKAGVPAELVVFPGAGHADPEFIKQASAADHRAKVAAFLDAHLKGK